MARGRVRSSPACRRRTGPRRRGRGMREQVHQLVIPQFVPTPLNQLMRGRRRDRIRLAKGDRELVGYYARLSGIPPATGKRRVSVEATMPGRRPDPDAILKSLLDALVAAELLRSDSSRWCQLGDVTIELGDQ